ncbi:MAG: phosphoadenosine phosphosulfate reductase family protein [Patescibacteria group bacterium]
MKRVIVALSGGKASAYCAWWALNNFEKDKVIFYFNDTKWEHPDLYRFISELSQKLNHEITEDSDGRNPEELFFDNHALANNRMPFCSRILKAERLQKFFKEGDTIIFGIANNEEKRAISIVGAYQKACAKYNKYLDKIIFPLLQENINMGQIDELLNKMDIKQPELYNLGFTHNNCYGGCVRAGKLHWKMLFEKIPEVYLSREQTEEKFNEKFKDGFGGEIHTILKNITLKDFRRKIENRSLPAMYYKDDQLTLGECFGICNSKA